MIWNNILPFWTVLSLSCKKTKKGFQVAFFMIYRIAALCGNVFCVHTFSGCCKMYTSQSTAAAAMERVAMHQRGGYQDQ